MDTVVRPTAPPIAEPAAPKRRWPGVVGAIAIALSVAIGVSIAWIANVEPLAPGSAIFGPAGVRITVPSPAPTVGSVDVDAFGTTGMVLEIPVRPEMRFTYLVSIRNDGPVSVEISDVGQRSPLGELDRHVVAFQEDRATTPDRKLVPFHPFTLVPGEEATLRMEVRITGSMCLTEDSHTSWWWEPVTFRVLGFFGFTRHADIDTQTEIRLVGDGHTNC